MPGGKNERPARRSNRASVTHVASTAPDDSNSAGRRSSRRSSAPQPDPVSSSKKQTQSASSSPSAAATAKREMPARAGSARAKQPPKKGKSADVKLEEEESGSEDNDKVQKDNGSDDQSSDEELTSKTRRASSRKTSVDLTTAKDNSSPGSRRAPVGKAKGRRSVLSQGRARRQPLRAPPRSSNGSPREKAAKEEEDSESEDDNDDDNETMEDNKEEDNQTKEGDDDDDDDDDDEESATKADDTESKQDDGQPQLRHSTRARRPAAKLRESSSSESESDDDEGTMDQPDVSAGNKRRNSSGGGPAAKRGRRKVLTDANRKPSRPTSSRNSTTGRGSAAARGSGGNSRARASAASRRSSGRRNSSASRGVGGSDSEAERDRRSGYHSHSDGDDDNSVADHAVANGDGVGGIGDGENGDSWYKSTAAHKAQRAAENAMLHHAPYLAYPWDDLYLGTHLGSAALNEYLRQQLRENTVRSGYARGGSVPQFTAQQCLSMVQSLRVWTVVPPPKSELHSVVQPKQQHGNTNKGDGEDYMEVAVDMEETKGQVGDNDMASEEKRSTTQFFFGPKIPLASMSRLYETMCEQDVTDGREERRQAQFMTADACVRRLKGMKEKIEQLNFREEQILRTSQSVGLATKGSISSNVEVNHLLGCIPRDDNGMSDEE